MVLAHGDGGLVAGLALGSTYVLSVGPNNMMIIREGLIRGRAMAMASTVLAAYVMLILLSYRLTEAIAARSASLVTVLSCLGLATMICFAALSIRAALGSRSRWVDALSGKEPLWICLRRALMVTALNPLIYIEYLLIPSSALGTLKDPALQQAFVLGLIVMAALACYGYALGGRACAGLLKHRWTMQAFDLACGCLLATLALTIGFGMLHART